MEDIVEKVHEFVLEIHQQFHHCLALLNISDSSLYKP